MIGPGGETPPAEEINYLAMSDEEIRNAPAPEPGVAAVAEVTPPVVDEPAAGEGQDDKDGKGEGEAGQPAGAAGDGEGGEGVDKPLPDAGNADKPAAGEATAPVLDAEGKEVPPAKDVPAGEGKPVETTVTDPAAPRDPLTYSAEEKVAAFDKMMAPFKANGRDFKVQSPDEAIRLQQQGANYTKKMQTLQPQLRIVKMLENSKLLDENKLAHLIDLSQGNPLAIQKLLADTGFDPMTVDKDKATDYKPGNHQVTDLEFQFNTALDDVLETPTGQELVNEVHGQWDKASKQVLFENPELLTSMNQQKANGLYKLITDEVERQKVLGTIGPEVPFLQAYRAMGDMLHAQGRLKPAAAPTPSVPAQQPTEIRTAVPASPVTNSDKAAAAATTKAAGTVEKPVPNFLGQSDEEFMRDLQKQRNGG